MQREQSECSPVSVYQGVCIVLCKVSLYRGIILNANIFFLEGTYTYVVDQIWKKN